MERNKNIDRQVLDKHSPYLNIIHDFTASLLSINPDIDWYAGWTVEEEGIYRFYDIDASGYLRSGEKKCFLPDNHLEFIFLCDAHPSPRKHPDDSLQRAILDITSPVQKTINKTLQSVTENLNRQETVDVFFEEGTPLFVYKRREKRKTTQAEWSLSLENLPASPQLKSLTHMFLDSLNRNGIIPKNKLIICEYRGRATFQFWVFRDWDKNAVGATYSFLTWVRHALRTTQGQKLTTKDILSLLSEAGCLSPLYRYYTVVLVQFIGVLSDTNKKGRIYKLEACPPKIDKSEVMGRDCVKYIYTRIWVEKKSTEAPTREEAIEALKAVGIFLDSKGNPSIEDCELDVQFVPLRREKVYALNCSYLEAIEVLTQGLKIFRCLWCGSPVEKNKGYDPEGIYCSRNCYNRFTERLKKQGQIKRGEGSRGQGKKHPKVKSYEEAYKSLREELGSRAYSKFWEKYEPYIGEKPRPYKRAKNF